MRILALLLASACLLAAEPLRFRITLRPEVAAKGTSGRLFVFMEKGSEAVERIKANVRVS